MTKLERFALEHFSKGPGEPVSGVGAVCVTRLLDKGWLVPHRTAQPFPRLYAITDSGRAALADDSSRSLQS